MLWFTVRDHDMLTPDDFMGDAFLSLAQIASADGRQIHLTLSRPTDEGEQNRRKNNLFKKKFIRFQY